MAALLGTAGLVGAQAIEQAPVAAAAPADLLPPARGILPGPAAGGDDPGSWGPCVPHPGATDNCQGWRLPPTATGNGFGTDDAPNVIVGGDFRVGAGAAEAEDLLVVRGDARFDKGYSVGVVGAGTAVSPAHRADYLVVGGSTTVATGYTVTVGGFVPFRAGTVRVGGDQNFRDPSYQEASSPYGILGDIDSANQTAPGGTQNLLYSDTSVLQTDHYDDLFGSQGKMARYSQQCYAELSTTTATTVYNEGGSLRLEKGAVATVGNELELTSTGSGDLVVFDLPATIGTATATVPINIAGVRPGATILLNTLSSGPVRQSIGDVTLGTQKVEAVSTGDVKRIVWNYPFSSDIQIGGTTQLPGSILVGSAGSRTTLGTSGGNGRVYTPGDLVHDGVGGTTGTEMHALPFDGSLGCVRASVGTFQLAKAVTGDGASLVPDDTEFTVRWEVTDGPDTGRTGELAVKADGTVVDGPTLAVGDKITFSEPDLPTVPGITWGTPRIVENPITIGEGATPVVTVTNTATLKSATFQLRKSVEGGGASLVPDDTGFTVRWEVTDGPDTGRTGELTVTADGTVQDGPPLRHGDVVRFSEPDLPTVPGVAWGTPTFSENPIRLDAGQPTPTITLTNRATVLTGSFTVRKVIDGAVGGAVPSETEFTVRWTVVSGPSEGRTGEITFLADGAAVNGPNDLVATDVVELSELTPPDVPGVVWGAATIAPSRFTIGTGQTPEVTVTNAATLRDASFGVKKVLTGDGASSVPAGTLFTVHYEVTAGPSKGTPEGEGDLRLKADGSVAAGPTLKHGDVVTLSEPTLPEIAGVVWGTPTFSTNPVTLDADAPVEITVTNTVELAQGTFEVRKELTGDGASAVPDGTTYTVHWAVTDGPSKGDEGDLMLRAGDAPVAPDRTFAPGDVVALTEKSPPAVDGVVWGAAQISPATVTIGGPGEAQVVVVTNTATLATGSFAIVKKLAGDGAGLVGQDSTFTIGWEVTDGPSAGRAGTLTVGADGTAADGPSLRRGDVVRLSEETPDPVPGTTWQGVRFSPRSVEITGAGGVVRVVATNTYALREASFTLHKQLVGDAAGDVPADTWFRVAYDVTDGPSRGASGTIAIKADGTVADGPELEHGDVVTFRELDPPDVPDVTWNGAVISPATVTLDGDADTPVAVTVTNTAERGLAHTGSSAGPLALGALLLIVLGGTALWVRRRWTA